MSYRRLPEILGTYKIRGYSPSAASYEGTLDTEAQGEALSLKWIFSATGCQGSEMTGVGFLVGDTLIASRAIADGSTDPQAGVVVYDIAQKGSLPARWYHVDLAGKLGQGLSSDGPLHSLAGTYVAEYGTGEQEFMPLRKELRAAGDRYHFSWLRGADLVYVGIGFVLGTKLVCGWATPRPRIDVLVYQRAQNSRKLCARWASLSRRKTAEARRKHLLFSV